VLLALSLFLTEKGGNHMIYNKLEGTTSKSFKLGKNGVIVESLDSGELKIVTKDYEFILGTDEVEGLLENGNQRTIASWQVVENYIITELEGVVGDLTGVEEALQQISGIAAAIDNDPDFYLHVLRLQDTAGNAVDGQIVKGTTTFEKDVTFGGKIIGPSTLTIDPFLADTSDPNNPNLGTVVIHGNLQIDGVTTTINSQTVDIVDKNITLAVGSLNAAAANGAGLTIDGTSLVENGPLASLLFNGSNNSFVFNRDIYVPKLNNLTVTQSSSDANNNFFTIAGPMSDNNTVSLKVEAFNTGSNRNITLRTTGSPNVRFDYDVTMLGRFNVGSSSQPLALIGLFAQTNANTYNLTFESKTDGGTTSNYALNGVTRNSGKRTLDLTLFPETTDPLEQTLKVNGLTAGQILYSNATNEISSLSEIVFNDGKIGIGTASPSEKLEVVGTVKATSFSSTVTTGTAPLSVLSTTLVTNLNADKLDGADLETSLTNNSDEKVPTSKAVGDYAVPKQLSILQNSVSYDSSLETNQKNNSYIYIYDNSGESGVAKKISVSEIHRPSAYIQRNQAQVVTAVKAGDFIYEEI
jgi:hypothetical protein